MSKINKVVVPTNGIKAFYELLQLIKVAEYKLETDNTISDKEQDIRFYNPLIRDAFIRSTYWVGMRNLIRCIAELDEQQYRLTQRLCLTYLQYANQTKCIDSDNKKIISAIRTYFPLEKDEEISFALIPFHQVSSRFFQEFGAFVFAFLRYDFSNPQSNRTLYPFNELPVAKNWYVLTL